MGIKISTETDTVIKKVIPYLCRRGYDIEKDVDFEVETKRLERYTKGYVDLLVTLGGKTPAFLIEAKRINKKLSDSDRRQAISYGKGHKVPFVVVTNGQDIQCFNVSNGEAIRWNGQIISKIPTRDQLKSVVGTFKGNKNALDISLGTDASLPFRPGLPLKQLNALFSRCHNVIRKIEKNEQFAFEDFAKLLFLKLLEEKQDNDEFFKLPYTYRFHELSERPDGEADQIKDAISSMINSICEKTTYGEVLSDPIHLKKSSTFIYIVRQLSKVSFFDSSLDSKGAAFEYYVRATLKGKKLGQYFTPRPLVKLMSCLVGKNKIYNSLLSGDEVRVVDPACGTGGFLVYLLQENRNKIEAEYKKGQITSQGRDKLLEKLLKKTFFGGDANDGVASAAKMNMIVAGDGHSNIQAGDSLTVDSTMWSVEQPTINIIITNPPFGTSEAESLSKNDLLQFPIPTTNRSLNFDLA